MANHAACDIIDRMSLPHSSTERPRIVTRIGILRLMYGILAIAYGLAMATSTSVYLDFMEESESDYASAEELTYVATFVGIFITIPGIASILVGIAALLRTRWAWTANVVLASILIVLATSDVALGSYNSALGIFFNGFILAYMFSRPVKAYLKSPPSAFVTPGTAAA